MMSNVLNLALLVCCLSTGKPTIIRRSPPDPVLKPEDNYTSILQLECHGVSSLYTLWYKNGMRITDVDPTSSQINVTVDINDGNFTCLTTNYPPCYKRLQTSSNHYDVLDMGECNNVFENETLIVKPEYPPIVKLYPDQREVTVNKYEYLNVRCSAKCHPKCTVTWKKDFQSLKSSDYISLIKNSRAKDLEIKNINKPQRGVYICLVNNIHGEVEKNFTLSVREIKDEIILVDVNNRTDIARIDFILVASVVVMFIKCILILTG